MKLKKSYFGSYFRTILGVISSLAFTSALTSTFTTAFAADAIGYTIEPYAGYGLLGGTSLTSVGVTKDAGNLTGIGLGTRATARFLDMFFAGADVSYYPSMSFSPPSTTTSSGAADSGAKILKAGLVGGISLPLLPLRFWLGWNILDRLSSSKIINSSTTDLTAKGMSFKVGAGYQVIPFLSLNAEYIMTTYTSGENTTQGTVTNQPSDYSLSHKMFVISASVPLNL